MQDDGNGSTPSCKLRAVVSLGIKVRDKLESGKGLECNSVTLFLLYPSKQTKETPHLPLFDKIAAKTTPFPSP